MFIPLARLNTSALKDDALYHEFGFCIRKICSCGGHAKRPWAKQSDGTFPNKGLTIVNLYVEIPWFGEVGD